MIVSDLPRGELRRRLRLSGLRVRVGPVIAEVKSPFEVIAAAIELHYASHEVAAATDFADFHVSIAPPRGARRWIRRQAFFHFDGVSPFTPTAAAQAFPMLEWGLNWCVSAHCHQYLVVHGAIVERSGRALILPAPPGSGKSTLCAALVARGWRLLSDELTIIDVASGRIVPMPRPISLKNESIDVIGRFWPAAPMSPVVHETLKGSISHVQPPPDSVRRSSETAAPGWLVLPRFRAGHATALEPLPRCAAFMTVVESAFNYSMHGRRGFEVVADLVAASRCLRFTYGGDLDEAVRTFDALSASTAC